MKKVIWAFSILLIAACSKDKVDTINENPDPEPTSEGIVIGEEVTLMIGPDGGTIISPDGMMELVFPEGALSGNTGVTIQAVTNNIPGGRGNVYRIGPGGTALNVPATIKLHYTEKDIEGSLAILLGVAFQGSDGIWYSIPDRTIDTLNRTISLSSLKLFTAEQTSKSSGSKSSPGSLDYGTFADLYIMPSGKTLRVNESSDFKVMVVIQPETMAGNDNEDDLPSLPRSREVSPRTVRRWAANGQTGNSAYGTIVPDGAQCTYKAPGTKPGGSRNPVQLSADLANLVYRNPVTGRDMTSLTLVAPVKIIDDNYAFQLKIWSKIESFPHAVAFWTLEDYASIDLDVRNGFVTVTGIHNENGWVSPASQSVPGECVSTWLDGESITGFLNVTNLTGETGQYGFDPELRSLILTVEQDSSMIPKFRLSCPDNEPVNHGGGLWGTSVTEYSFILKDSTQRYPSLNPQLTVILESKQENK